MNAFGEKNGAWLVRTNSWRLTLSHQRADHSDPEWRKKQVNISIFNTLTLYLKTLSDDMAERNYDWNQNKDKVSRE